MLKDKPYGPAPLLPSNIFIIVLVASCTILLFSYNGEYKRLHCEKRNNTQNRYSKLSSDLPGNTTNDSANGTLPNKLADPLLVRISSNSNTESTSAQNSRRDEVSFVGHYRYTMNTPLKEEEEEEEDVSGATVDNDESGKK